MFDAARKYVYDRRRGLFETSVVLCGAYAVNRYVNERLEEVKEKVVRERAAREALRRRFQSTHDDACFTIMALVPTLAEQILEEMDVESLTDELQSLSRTSRTRSRFQHPGSESEFSSVSDVHSDAGSASVSSYSSYSGVDGETSSNLVASTGSWVDRFSSSSSYRSPIEQLQQPHDFLASAGNRLSDSITTASSSLSYNPGAPLHEPRASMSTSMSESSTRTKAQLWKEVKMLTLTRTLTTLYTTTLLSLLTSIQLALLARERYVTSVLSTERAERIREAAPTLSGLIFREAVSRVVDVEAIWPAWCAGQEGWDEEVEGISEETEMRFLTLSWWILHVGWKDVAARVRGSVEAVFEGVSLKTKLSPSELHVLIMDVRRRVERDGTGDNKASMSGRFLGSLLPPTPETTAHVLAQGGALPQVPFEPSPLPSSSISSLRDCDDSLPIAGPTPREGVFPTPPSSIPPSSPSLSSSRPAPNTASPPPPSQPRAELNDPIFSSLLSQTRAYLVGPDFAYALSAALDRATGVLVDGLRAKVFVDSSTTNALEGLSATDPIDLTMEEEAREEIKIRLAGLLPGLARWSQLALNAVPNELVDNVMAVRELGALEAIVMSDYQDRYTS
ncbi:Peroxin-3-domain-containing protein [Suillus paluster]|uniref:Peroxin-3-domain-containing protein n=1 Tax=Suillus paluster TaxID=48578 RepID=UPI001B882A75|nr:Peroxin-3-domain-containing protein [Suillus paluster]KAG1722114.1 Peroxin-3-domain-containing protein [Suillus paluster]